MTNLNKDINKDVVFAETPPLLSVCIITYNHEAYIAQAIESVLSQKTDFPFEIIVGEDESTDRTRDIVVEFRNRYPDKIRLVFNSRKEVIFVNGRATGRWNLIQTLSNARGKYVALIEGDDYWIDSSKLQNQIHFLEGHPEYVVCGHWVEIVDIKGNESGKERLGLRCPQVFLLDDAIRGPTVHTSSLVFRNFDIKSNFAYPYLLVFPAGDILIIPMLLGYGDGYCFRETWSAYRKHPGGFWTAKPEYLRYFELFQIEYAFAKLYPKPFSLARSLNRVALLSQSFLQLVTFSAKHFSLAYLVDFTVILARQDVIKCPICILFYLMGVFLLPLKIFINITKCLREKYQQWVSKNLF